MSSNIDDSSIKCKYDYDNLTIGSTTVPRYKTDVCSKVPNVLFYDLPQVRIKCQITVMIYKYKVCRINWGKCKWI